MQARIAKDGASCEVEADCSPLRLLGNVDVPVVGAELALSSGRRYELRATSEGDRVTVRGRGGAVVLRVLVTDDGPQLVFEGANIEIVAAGKLALSGQEVSIESGRSLAIAAGGDCTTLIGGSRQTRIGGGDRMEAAAIQAQANDGCLELRASGRIALNGEHIGLNDDACPRPFDWSKLSGRAEEET